MNHVPKAFVPRSIAVIVSLALVSLLGASAAAQGTAPPDQSAPQPPDEEPPDATQPPDAPQPPDPSPEDRPLDVPASPDASAPLGEDPEVAKFYELGLDAFSEGRFAEAEFFFRDVSQRSRVPLRRAIAEELARESAARIGKPVPERPGLPNGSADDQRHDRESARLSFLGTTLVLGLNYGWMVPLALEVDDAKAFAGLYMLTAGASFVGPYLATRNTHVTGGMSSLGGGGAVLGLGHGALLHLLVYGDETDSLDESSYFGAMVASSVLEGVGGYLWAKNTDMDEGPADAAVAGGVVGAGVVLTLDLLALGDDIDELGARGVAGTVLLGSGLGIAGGYYAGKTRRYSAGDVYIVESAGVVGAYLGATSLVLLDADDSPRLVAGVLLGSGVAGLVLGDRLVRDIHASNGQGGLVALGTVAGGLVGAGVGFLVAPDDGQPENWLMTASVLGAGAGLGVMYKVIDFDRESLSSDGPRVLGMSPWLGADDAHGIGVFGQF